MRYLLDEQLDQVVAASMAPIASKSADEFLHILAVARPGTPDEEIPRLCREQNVDCLVTANVRDFGARKFLLPGASRRGPSRCRLEARQSEVLRGRTAFAVVEVLSGDSGGGSFRREPSTHGVHAFGCTFPFHRRARRGVR